MNKITIQITDEKGNVRKLYVGDRIESQTVDDIVSIIRQGFAEFGLFPCSECKEICVDYLEDFETYKFYCKTCAEKKGLVQNAAD